ncbi:MAG TPA: hypothetical protein VK047_06860 [Zeimonas sp.]|nr:hypothetical protein [Zeimonas sp.]
MSPERADDASGFGRAPACAAAAATIREIARTRLLVFPADAAALRALGEEAAEARIWAGIHTRSDVDAGAGLGRVVAWKGLQKAGWSVP